MNYDVNGKESVAEHNVISGGSMEAPREKNPGNTTERRNKTTPGAVIGRSYAKVTVNSPEIARVPDAVQLRRRYKTRPLTAYVPEWQEEFLAEAARVFGRPKAEFVRAALLIIINRIVEKYASTHPEIAKISALIPER